MFLTFLNHGEWQPWQLANERSMPGQCHEIWCRQRHEQARGSGCILGLVSTNVLCHLCRISKTSGWFCFVSITFGDVILQLLVVFMVDCGCYSPNWQELLKRENVVWAKPLTKIGAKVHRGKGSWGRARFQSQKPSNLEGWEILYGFVTWTVFVWMMIIWFNFQVGNLLMFDLWSSDCIKLSITLSFVGSRPRRWTSNMVVRVSGVCSVPFVLHSCFSNWVGPGGCLWISWYSL